MELTKEYFDSKNGQLVSKDYLKDYLDERLAILVDYLEQRLLEFPTKTEFSILKNKVDTIAMEICDLNLRNKQDSDALARDYVSHEKRISRIENKHKSIC